MFSLHETTQRRVCRTAFVAGCVLPTICVIFWTAYLNRPWRESDWQQTLREQLHVQATVGQVSSPRPGITQLQEVQIADLRSGRQLGKITDLRFERWKSSLIADRIEIAADQLPEFATSLATWISSGELPALELQAASVRFIGPNGEATEMKNVRVKSSESGNSDKLIDLQATPTNATEGGNLHLRIWQPTGEAEPKIVMQVDTQGERLPAWLLADFVPGMRGCAFAQFAGQLRIESLQQSTQGKISGSLDRIDLKQLVSNAGSHRLEGNASLQIDDLQWTDRRLSLMQGQLLAEQGRVSHSLLSTLSKHHHFLLGQHLASTNYSEETMHLFDELALNFQISSAGVAISGACETGRNNAEGCLVTHEGQPMLYQPNYRALQVARLVQVFTPMRSDTSWLPATIEANAMGEVLPLPSTSPGPRGGPAVRADEKSE